MRGGKRPGAGRPAGSKNKTDLGWVKFSTKVSPEVWEYLQQKKADGFMISRVVDAAIRKDMDKP